MANQKSSLTSPVSRDSAGLRDAMFDEIDALRNGSGNPTRCNAVARSASVIIDSVHMDMEVAKFLNRSEELPDTLPKPLQLGRRRR